MKEIQAKKTTIIHLVHSASVHGKHTHNYATNHKNHSWRALEDQKSSNRQEKERLKKKSHWERWHTEESPTPWIPKCYSLPLFCSRGEQSNKLNSGPGMGAKRSCDGAGEEKTTIPARITVRNPIITPGRFCNSVTLKGTNIRSGCQIPL